MMTTAKITIIGNLGGDPETRYTKAGKMNVTFSVATNRKQKDGNGGEREIVNWYRVTAWGNLAETLDRFVQDGSLTKGSGVAVFGRYYYDTFTDRDGNPRETHEVNADDISLLGGREGAPQSQGRGASSMPRERTPVGVAAGDDVDDLPF